MTECKASCNTFVERLRCCSSEVLKGNKSNLVDVKEVDDVPDEVSSQHFSKVPATNWADLAPPTLPNAKSPDSTKAVAAVAESKEEASIEPHDPNDSIPVLAVSMKEADVVESSNSAFVSAPKVDNSLDAPSAAPVESDEDRDKKRKGLMPQHRWDTSEGNEPQWSIVDSVAKIALAGAGQIFLGNFFFLCVHLYCDARDSETHVLNLIASLVVCVGAGCFFLSAIVKEDPEILLGSILLSFAVLFFTAASVVALAKGELDSSFQGMNAVALILELVAIACLMKRGHMRRKKPWLNVANFMFYTTIAYGIGAIILLLHTLEATTEPAWRTLGIMMQVLGSVFLVILANTTLCNLDRVMEDRYPATTYLHGGLLPAKAAYYACWICLFGRLFAVVTHLLSEGDAAGVAVGIGDFILALGAFMLCAALHGFPTAVPLQGRPQLVLGAGFFALGLLVRGGSTVALNKAELLEAGQSNSNVCGSLACILGQLALACFVARPQFFQSPPLHPGNYFFYAFSGGCLGDILVFVATAGLRDASWRQATIDLGACISLMGALLLPLHGHMSLEVSLIDSCTLWDYEQPENAMLPDASSNDTKDKSHPLKGSTPVKEVEVLICGGGPVGLTLSNELGERGVKTLCVELRYEPIADPRFFFLNPWTMEGLDRLGVSDELKKSGLPQDCKDGCAWTNGLAQPDAEMIASACTPGRSYMEKVLPNLHVVTGSRAVNSRYQQMCGQRIMQSRQEVIMKAAAENRASVEVLYGHKVLDFEEKPGGFVEAYVEQVPKTSDAIEAHKTSESGFRVRAQYLVGCDGPGGPIARTLKFKYDGLANVTNTNSCLVQSAEIARLVTKHVGDAVQYQVSRPGVGIGLFVRICPKDHLFNFIARWLYDPKGLPTNAEAIRTFAGDVEFKIVTEGFWYWNFFIARTFRQSRVLLCGDAAHSWPPVCGLGGNTGYADAGNLGWKLSAVIRGWGGEDLLDSYTLERRSSCLRAAQCVMVCMPRPKMALLLCKAWEKVRALYPRLQFLIRWRWMYGNSGEHIGNHHCTSGVWLGLRYDLSPVIMAEEVIPPDDAFCKYIPRICSGARLPYFPLRDGTPLFHALSFNGYTLLVMVPTLYDNTDGDQGLIKVHPASGSDPSTRFILPSDFSAPQQSFSGTLSRCLGQVSRSVTELFSSKPDLRSPSPSQYPESAVEISIAKLADQFAKHEAPLKVVSLVGQFSNEELQGAHKECAHLYRSEALVLVRPDTIVAWHLPLSKCRTGMTEESVLAVVQTLLGRASKADPVRTTRTARAKASLRWLTSRFIFSLQPYTVLFPQAVKLKNETKEDAIAMLKAKAGVKGDVDLTTKMMKKPEASAAA